MFCLALSRSNIHDDIDICDDCDDCDVGVVLDVVDVLGVPGKSLYWMNQGNCTVAIFFQRGSLRAKDWRYLDVIESRNRLLTGNDNMIISTTSIGKSWKLVCRLVGCG